MSSQEYASGVSSSSQAMRASKYKQTRATDAGTMRERRATQQSDLRKRQQSEILAKRRRDLLADESPTVQEYLNQLPQIAAGILSDDPELQLDCTIKIRRLLSKERSPPIDRVVQINNGILIPRLVSFLNTENGNTLLQFEAAWALTNIVSGDSVYTSLVVAADAVPYFVALLYSQDDNVKEQAVWALGNIAGDKPAFRDVVLHNGVMTPLVTIIRSSSKMAMVRNATWTLSNLCRGKTPPPNMQIISPALSVIPILLYVKDEEILTDTCWALSYLTDADSLQIQTIVDTGITPRLTELLLHHNINVVTPAVRTVGNIVTADDRLTQVVVNHGVLAKLGTLLHGLRDNIKKEACWTISNITAGSADQIQAVINANLIPPLLVQLQTGEPKTRKEAAWAIANACAGGLQQQVLFIVDAGAVLPLCAQLVSTDLKLVHMILQALDRVFFFCPETLDLVESQNVHHVIESLQNSPAPNVAQKAAELIRNHVSDESYEALAPAQTQSAYQFGGIAPSNGGFKF
ncbi:hypothetical protein CAOG_04781 [Capsaspora owczarzaki ATCC 30864]|uniref:Importin subunit alpha n=1 Tax=Capsaspora owczarzaki (strain ATCC 30864) TaxID=595528 RepID=A0A0D2X3C9_CAPO3|nr:hypothetical protein CAOG_04781 [Capsaspora owczarzaki ATCC 30864]KJE94089.1 hypothetical protein CAOG_004781 [Capsaspora owczarzaki ATCC 30864]|eukprot:XP_004347532.1 hypothetical protein CAOG_04781 [Capsaspora owczarzaki ATCC 30864]